MIKEKDVLKAIVESRRADGRTYYEDVEKYLGVNRRFLKDHIFSLKEKGCVDIFLKTIFKLWSVNLIPAYSNPLMPVSIICNLYFFF